MGNHQVGSFEGSNCRLVVQDDGNLVAYDDGLSVVWSSDKIVGLNLVMTLKVTSESLLGSREELVV